MFDYRLGQILNRYSGRTATYPEDKPDIIQILSYGTLPTRLTEATMETTFRGAQIWRHSQDAIIVFGNAEYLFHMAAHTEARYKRDMLRKYGVPDSRMMDIGAINNSVQESMATRNALQEARITAKKICLVTGSMHKPSAYAIWKYVFPEANIFVSTIPYWREVQSDHPVLVQRGPWRWLAANMARHYGFLASVYCEKHLPFMPITPAHLAKWHHRASTD
ncbi:MAG: YdcF family protein [Candidatus Sungbacteria bacterium]|uniref:YdcF family protein n=1 Tax=Candidatus Sungiibacteriota bacterium TaxID=2750080 RepID=A0A932QXR3_9BACT|nr:YdcF family protein [Candidatus Sungbacteria bacterium]